MGRKTAAFIPGILLCVCLGSCDSVVDPELADNGLVTGYMPVYSSASASEITLLPSRPVENPGKIYVYGKYLLVNEVRKGIHVFDNTNPAEPAGIGFLQILGNSDMAVKDGMLYADHMGNLVALSVMDFDGIEEKGRLPLRNWLLGIPPPSNSYFECVDPAKGLVVFWKKSELKNPECYALQ